MRVGLIGCGSISDTHARAIGRIPGAEVSTARADRLIAATDAAGVKLGVFFQDRLEPDMLALKQLVAGGTLGRPTLASGRVKWYRTPEYHSGSRWRGTWAGDGGGALMNQGIHTVDLLLSLFGPVARVSAAVATRLHRIEVEDTAVAVLEFANGAIGTLEVATSAYPGYARRVEVTGTEGTAILEQSRLVNVETRTPAAADAWRPTGNAPAPENATSPVVSDATGHRRMFEDFFRAIETGDTPCCDGREGRRSVAVVEAIYASAREGKAVSVQGGPR